MKLEHLFGIVFVIMVGLLSAVSPDAVYMLGLFAIGWQIPGLSKTLANLFRKRNQVEA